MDSTELSQTHHFDTEIDALITYSEPSEHSIVIVLASCTGPTRMTSG